MGEAKVKLKQAEKRLLNSPRRVIVLRRPLRHEMMIAQEDNTG